LDGLILQGGAFGEDSSSDDDLLMLSRKIVKVKDDSVACESEELDDVLSVQKRTERSVEGGLNSG